MPLIKRQKYFGLTAEFGWKQVDGIQLKNQRENRATQDIDSIALDSADAMRGNRA